jgi:hypothetical protein
LGGSAVGSAACTNAVEAACVVFVPPVAVGTIGVPVRVGDAESTTVVPVPVVVAPLNAVPLPLTTVAVGTLGTALANTTAPVPVVVAPTS